jgi:hypothetical protein
MHQTIATVLFLVSLSFGQQAAPANPCDVPQQKQFDFWVGEWDLTWPGDKPNETAHGVNSIHRTLGNCVVEENFDGGASMPLRGKSLSTFDSRSGKWKQTWVDNQGSYLDFVGQFENGHMILSRIGAKPDGTKILQRMVWNNITRDEFDWTWESSSDGGKTWKVLWPIHYKRKA